MKDLKLIPLDELVSKTKFTKTDGVRSLAELSSRAVHVKRKLKSLYQSLNTGGTSLPFNVMEVAIIIDKLMERIGTKTSEESDADGYYTIELTLLSDKGVNLLNQVHEIVREHRLKYEKIELDVRDYDVAG